MNSLVTSCIAAACAALSNLFFRKNAGSSVSANGHLACHYTVSFLLSFLICKDIFHLPLSVPMVSVGSAVGVLNICLMLFTYRAVQKGPSGLTYALQSSSCIFPGLLLFFLFGEEFGFKFTYFQAIGMALVIFGFFMAAKKGEKENTGISLPWAKFAFAGFLVQVGAMTLIQSRCLLFTPELTEHPLIPTNVGAQSDVWFMPGMFGAAMAVQLAIFLREKRLPTLSEMLYGILTGSMGALSTLFLSLATKNATPEQTAIIFPLFAVVTLILCNLWAYKWYNERFNVLANASCSAGIFIGLIQ